MLDVGWERVAVDLRRVALAVAPFGGGLRRGALHLRIAVLGVRAALAQHLDAVREALAGTELPTGDDTLPALEAALETQLAGAVSAFPVLEHLPAEARSAADAEVRRALDADPDYKPALRAAAALAAAAGDFGLAALWTKRLADLPGMPEIRADALQALAQLHWRKLGEPRLAREMLQRARELQPDDLVLVDKLLKLDLEMENWEDAVVACQHLVLQLGRKRENPELSVTYLLTLGEIQLYGLKNPALSLKFYLDAVERLPEYPLTFSLMQDLMEARAEEALNGQLALLDPTAESFNRRKHTVDLLRAAMNAHRGPQEAIRAFRDAVGFVAGP